MEFLANWKFWLFTITVLSGIVNWLSNYKIMNNDLKHLAEDIKDIKGKVDNNAIAIANIEGKLYGKNKSDK